MNKLFPEYADRSLDEFQILHPSHEAALSKVKDYIGMMDDMLRVGHGLTFLGPTGVGKTFLAEMVMKAAVEQTRWGHVESIESNNYVELYQDRMRHDEKGDRADKQIDWINFKARFVLFDDVGREHLGASDWSSHLLFNALRTRTNRRLPFLITSNLSPLELKERYSEGFISILHGKTDIIVIEGEDYRCVKGR